MLAIRFIQLNFLHFTIEGIVSCLHRRVDIYQITDVTTNHH
jgi:hypothetical protein